MNIDVKARMIGNYIGPHLELFFKKPTNSHLYTELTYKSPTIKITAKCLPQNLTNEIDPSLLEKDLSYIQ